MHAPVVLVTGCSSGIGKSTCEHLAANGRRVFGGSRSACAPTAWTYLPIDVTQEDSVAQAVATVHASEGRIDALVTAAGRSLMGALEETTIDEAKAILTGVPGLKINLDPEIAIEFMPEK